MNNFWQKLNKPIIASAPMAGVTDVVFRRVLAKYGKPDVMFTEFVSCAGLCSGGKERLSVQLKYDKSERPIVAQLFGSVPEHFYISAKICKDLGFDGIDINMGCPDKSVIKQKAGSRLINEFELVSEIIKATKDGASDLPVSVKTRLGYESTDEAAAWFTHLLNQSPAVVSVHGRTKKQGYAGEVDWDKIEMVKKMAFKISPETLIIGNGNVLNVLDAETKAKKYDLDGIMIGRGMLLDPLVFNKEKSIQDLNLEERKNFLLKHAEIFIKIYKDSKGFYDLRKFYKTYISDFTDAKELRAEMMKANNLEELKKILKSI
jgi:nifR3 family TIM-barrel protein